ncbi:MAG: formamidopyrimidine-DNA glycosylase [Alphaproteobacteria bacterium]|nr:MAG: formamidopyrimidine-DNA glycosylase [Alphaproteobacteria bacterium]
MPELPEVETVRRGLAAVMEGATIGSVELNRADLRFPFPDGFAARLTGRRITALGRRAKYLLADLDDRQVLVMHLGMSGSFRITRGTDERVPGAFHHERARDARHDHVVFRLRRNDEAVTVVYNDPRRFGFMDLVARDRLDSHALFAKLGLEPTGDAFDAAAVARLFAGRTAPLKAALIDQRLIAGLGNIYVCEALWQAGLSPQRPAGSIARADGRPGAACRRLAAAVRDVINRAIAAGGSTIRDHRLADGSLGYFQHEFRVYDREGEACRRAGCAGTVRRIVQSGRSTFFCPSCQR